MNLRRALAVAALAVAAAPCGMAEAQPRASQGQPPSAAVAMIVDFAKGFHEKGVRTIIVYLEMDNGSSPTDKKVGISISGIVAETNQLIAYKGDTAAFMKALSAEANAGGWGKTLIVDDNGAVTVEYGPSPGAIEGFSDRAEHAVGDVAAKILNANLIGK